MKSFIKVKRMNCPICGKGMKCVSINYTDQEASNKIANASETVCVCDCSKPGESEHITKMTIQQRESVETETW